MQSPVEAASAEDDASAGESSILSRPFSSGLTSSAGPSLPQSAPANRPRPSGGRGKDPFNLDELKQGNDIYLKGKLEKDISGDHVFRGFWSMNYREFANKGTRSEFQLRHRSVDPDDTEMFPFSGTYNGFYNLKETVNRYVKHHEQDVELVFIRHSAKGFNVEGMGRNQFGKYNIKGLLSDVSLTEGTCEIFRLYQQGTAPPPGAVTSAVRAMAASHAPSPSYPAPSTPKAAIPHTHFPAPAAAVNASYPSFHQQIPSGLKSAPPAPAAAVSHLGANGPASAAGDRKKKPSLKSITSPFKAVGPQKQMTDKLIKRCVQMLRDLRQSGQHACNWFMRPVTEFEAPGYFNVISKPMDLGTVDAKVRSKQYRLLSEFIGDVRLVFQNAMKYNNNQHPVYHDAQSLLNCWETLYKQVCQELKHPYDDGSGRVSPPPKAIKKKPDPVGPRTLPISQQGTSAVFRDAQADDNPLQNSIVKHYKEQMETAIRKLVEVEAEKATLQAQLDGMRSMSKRLEILEMENAAYRGEAAPIKSFEEVAATAVPEPMDVQAETDRRLAKVESKAQTVVAPVTVHERQLLSDYINAISQSDDADLVSALMEVIKQQHSFGSNEDEYEVDVNAFDDVTVRALIKFCEPYFDSPAVEEGTGPTDNGHAPLEDQGTEQSIDGPAPGGSVPEYFVEEEKAAVKRERMEGSIEADDQRGEAKRARVEAPPEDPSEMEQSPSPGGQPEVDRPTEAEEEPAEELATEPATANDSVAMEENVPEVTTPTEQPSEAATAGETQEDQKTAQQGEKWEKEEEQEEEEEEEGEEGALEKWMAQEAGAGNDLDGSSVGQRFGQGAAEGEDSEESSEQSKKEHELWQQARLEMTEGMAREKAREEEEKRRLEERERIEEKRRAEMADHEQRQRRAREEAEEVAREKAKEEQEQEQKAIMQARERARIQRMSQG